MQDKEEKKLASVRSVTKVYWHHTKKFWLPFVFVVVGNIGIQAADLAAPWYLRTFFNTLASQNPSPTLARNLLFTVAIVASIMLASWAFRRLQSRSIMYLELNVMRDLTVTAFNYLIHHSYNFFVSRFAGTLTHRVNRFARVYESLMDAVALQFFPTFLFVVGAIVVLYLRHPWLGLGLAGWSIVFLGFQIWVANLRQPLRAVRADEEAKATGVVADAISNHSTVMLFASASHEKNLLTKA